jgi:hypothetical protein
LRGAPAKKRGEIARLVRDHGDLARPASTV